MKLIAALTVSLSMLVAQRELVAQTERPAQYAVTAVRHWSLPDVTRVVIEVSGEFNFVTERLHNPERVYYDIPNSRPRLESRRSSSEQIDDKLLKRIRVAETLPGVTRVVLDLAGTVEATTSQLTNPNRLIVELRSAGPGAAIPAELPPALSTSPKPAPMPPLGIKPEPPKSEPSKSEPPKSEPPNLETPQVESSPLAKPSAKPPVKVDGPGDPLAVESKSAPVPDLPKPAAIAASETPLPPVPSEISKAARHTSTGRTSLVRALGLKVGRVVIDPGHGGHDVGTEGPKGLLEKDLVLDVAKRVGKLVEDRMGAEVIYTRTDDTFIPLEGRTALANEKKADLFLSIHANSSLVTRIAGVETYYLNFTDSKDALDVASRENASSQKSIFELRDIIQKITLHDKAEESKEFAGRIQTALYGFSARNLPNSRNRGVKKAPFVVLIGANMPSVLAEIGFLSNAREETLLKKPDYRQKLAEALFRGLSRYADSLSHFQVAQAQN
ncbi:N-acetylmuramoyl-L-alanine amidase [Candidatus Sulfopaludibacter sp. SbA6]|nr:N-acetylmuramoyl-L-alanine amidase [Candidatus Sulfopaludibacter sp. SbA6]